MKYVFEVDGGNNYKALLEKTGSKAPFTKTVF